MKLIFLAGPYRDATEYGVHLNIQHAEEFAMAVWKMGAACFCPHKNSAYLGDPELDPIYLAGDLLILSRCDALLAIAGWEDSAGAQGEVREAQRLGLPVFRNTIALGEWLSQGDCYAKPSDH